MLFTLTDVFVMCLLCFCRGMFAGGLREMQQTEIAVHGVTYLAMNKLLDFIYTSELELDLDSVQEVLSAATLLQVTTYIGTE